MGIAPLWGTVGLTAAASIGGWVELILLRRTLSRRIGETGLPPSLSLRLWSAAIAAAGVAWAIKLSIPPVHPIAGAALVLTPFGVTFLGLALLLGVPEAHGVFARVRRASHRR